MSEDSSNEQTMELFGGTTQTKQIAIGIILAALCAVSGIIPISGFIGASGGFVASLTVMIFIAPLFGILLGPRNGFVFGLIGGIAAAMLGSSAGIYFLVPTVILGPAISGLFTGLCVDRSSRIPGPLITSIFLLSVIVLYLIPCAEAWWFMVYYIGAAVQALVLQFSGISFDPTRTGMAKFAQLIPLTFIGTMTDFSMMTMGAVYILNIPAFVFGTAIFPAMLVERSAAMIVSAILASVVIVAFRHDIDVLIPFKES